MPEPKVPITGVDVKKLQQDANVAFKKTQELAKSKIPLSPDIDNPIPKSMQNIDWVALAEKDPDFVIGAYQAIGPTLDENVRRIASPSAEDIQRETYAGLTPQERRDRMLGNLTEEQRQEKLLDFERQRTLSQENVEQQKDLATWNLKNIQTPLIELQHKIANEDFKLQHPEYPIIKSALDKFQNGETRTPEEDAILVRHLGIPDETTKIAQSAFATNAKQYQTDVKSEDPKVVAGALAKYSKMNEQIMRAFNLEYAMKVQENTMRQKALDVDIARQKAEEAHIKRVEDLDKLRYSADLSQNAMKAINEEAKTFTDTIKDAFKFRYGMDKESPDLNGALQSARQTIVNNANSFYLKLLDYLPKLQGLLQDIAPGDMQNEYNKRAQSEVISRALTTYYNLKTNVGSQLSEQELDDLKTSIIEAIGR